MKKKKTETARAENTAAEKSIYALLCDQEKPEKTVLTGGVPDEKGTEPDGEETEEIISGEPDKTDASPDVEELARRIRWELQEIGKHDPAVTSIDDLAALDRADAIYERVRRGYTYLDAYESVYRDRIQQTAAAEALQRALNSARSKSHLTGTTQRGAGSVPVPAEELALYRALIPQATRSEILRNYNTYLNH